MIQVLHRAVNILEYIAQAQGPGLGEIAAATQLHLATAARILKTLMAAGYVEQVAPKKGYILGPMAYALAAGSGYRQDLVILAEPIMRQLSRALKQPVILVVLRQGRRFILSQINIGEMMAASAGPQLPTNPYQSATGRLLLAYETERKKILERLPLPGSAWPEVATRRQLRLALAHIRTAGLAVRFTGETAGIACPIWGTKSVPAALGTFLPESQFKAQRRQNILRQMRQASKAIGLLIRKGRPLKEGAKPVSNLNHKPV